MSSSYPPFSSSASLWLVLQLLDVQIYSTRLLFLGGGATALGTWPSISSSSEMDSASPPRNCLKFLMSCGIFFDTCKRGDFLWRMVLRYCSSAWTARSRSPFLQEVTDSTVVAGAIVTFKLLSNHDLFFLLLFYSWATFFLLLSHDQGFVFCSPFLLSLLLVLSSCSDKSCSLVLRRESPKPVGEGLVPLEDVDWRVVVGCGASSLEHWKVKITKGLFSHQVGQFWMLQFLAKLSTVSCMVPAFWEEVP